MKILIRTAFIASVICSALTAVPAWSANVGDACTEADVGRAQLDSKRENMIVCLLDEDGKTASWKTMVREKRYSKTCEDWESAGHKSKRDCVQDGRWHFIYMSDDHGNAAFGDYTELEQHVAEGADVKIMSQNPSIGNTLCTNVSWTPNGLTCYSTALGGVGPRYKKGDSLEDLGGGGFGTFSVSANGLKVSQSIGEAKHYSDGVHASVLADNWIYGYAWFVKY